MNQKEWFIFNGISSRELGVYLVDAPNRTIPKVKTSITDNNFMHGSKIEMQGVGTFDLSLKIGFSTRKEDRTEEIYSWLQTGQTGRLAFWNDLERYYTVYLTDQIDFVESNRYIKTATIKFIVQPFKKYTNETETVINNPMSPFKIVNRGNYASEPIITMTGTGIVSIVVNCDTLCVVDFGSASRTLVLDCEEKDCILTNGALANRSMNGVFPTFKPGTNTISILGNGLISQIKIKMNARWL